MDSRTGDNHLLSIIGWAHALVVQIVLGPVASCRSRFYAADGRQCRLVETGDATMPDFLQKHIRSCVIGFNAISLLKFGRTVGQ